MRSRRHAVTWSTEGWQRRTQEPARCSPGRFARPRSGRRGHRPLVSRDRERKFRHSASLREYSSAIVAERVARAAVRASKCAARQRRAFDRSCEVHRLAEMKTIGAQALSALLEKCSGIIRRRGINDAEGPRCRLHRSREQRARSHRDRRTRRNIVVVRGSESPLLQKFCGIYHRDIAELAANGSMRTSSTNQPCVGGRCRRGQGRKHSDRATCAFDVVMLPSTPGEVARKVPRQHNA